MGQKSAKECLAEVCRKLTKMRKWSSNGRAPCFENWASDGQQCQIARCTVQEHSDIKDLLGIMRCTRSSSSGSMSPSSSTMKFSTSADDDESVSSSSSSTADAFAVLAFSSSSESSMMPLRLLSSRTARIYTVSCLPDNLVHIKAYIL